MAKRNYTSKSMDMMNFGTEFDVASINASKINIIGGLVVNDARDNVKIGTDAAFFLTTGHDNVLLGNQAGYYLTTGSNNVAIGLRSGWRLNTAVNNVLLGNNSGRYCMGDENVLLGTEAGSGPGPGVWTGQYNVGIGNKCLYTGANSFCTAVGFESGYNSNFGATQNTLVGFRCGYSITSADQCTMLGVEAGYGTTTAESPIIIDNTNHNLDVRYGPAPLGPYTDYPLVLVNGSYTAATLATQIQTQLNTIPGASFTVTSPANNLIHVVCNTAATQYQFRFASGPNAATSLITVLSPTADTPMINSDDAPFYYEMATKMGRLVCLGYRSGYFNNGYDSVMIGTKAGIGSATYTASNCVYIGNSCAAAAGGGNFNTAVGFECGYSMLSTATNNALYGYQCGWKLTSADNCTLIGVQSGYSTTTGGANQGRLVCLGYQSGYGCNADDCVYIGTKCGFTGGGDFNTAVGFECGYTMDSTSSENTLLGTYCAHALVSGDSNVAIGSHCIETVHHGDKNIAIGTYCLATAGHCNQNIAIGAYAGYSYTANVPGSLGNNIYMGVDAGRYCTTGVSNVVIGNGAMCGSSLYMLNTTATVAIGYQAGFFNRSGNGVLIGTAAGYGKNSVSYTTTYPNVFIGSNVAHEISGGLGGNVALGYQALYNHTQIGQTVAIGYDAGFNARAANELNPSGFPGRHVMIGYMAGLGAALYSADSCVFIGTEAGKNITGGVRNIGIGDSCLLSVTSGVDNVAIGSAAGANLTLAQHNVLIGSSTAQYLTTGSGNICIGWYCAYGNLGNALTSGLENVLVGNGANVYETDSSYGVAVGSSAKCASNCTAIGNASGANYDPGFGALPTVAVGSGAQATSNAAGRSSMAIGYNCSAGAGECRVGGTSGQNFFSALRVPSNWIADSDRRYKRDIRSIDTATAVRVVEQLNPCGYRLAAETDPDAPEHFGLIAQEVQQALTTVGIDSKAHTVVSADKSNVVDGDGPTLGLNYSEIGILQLAAMKNMLRRLAAIEAVLQLNQV